MLIGTGVNVHNSTLNTELYDISTRFTKKKLRENMRSCGFFVASTISNFNRSRKIFFHGHNEMSNTRKKTS